VGSGIALVLYNSFWVIHVIVGVVLNVCFGKQLTHIVYLDMLIFNRIWIYDCMLGLAMDFNVLYLMVFKILVDALDFAMDSAYACEFECM